MADGQGAPREPVRIDKWLWAARLYKSRSLATLACNAGHVKIDGAACKPARLLRGGERLEALTPGGPRIVEVLALADKRVAPPIAATLYTDHSPPRPPRDDLFGGPSFTRGGRPTKRDRRRLEALRSEGDAPDELDD